MFLLSSLLFCFTKITAKNPPNIIFIFADDLGWGDLSCYGNDDIKTPSLDKLANEGTLFTQFYVSGSVCSPSRAGIMTGLYPARNRIFGHLATHQINERREMPDALNPNVTTLTDILKQAGYTTAHFGKWHLGNIPPSEYGIDIYRTDNFSNIADGKPIDIWSPQVRPTATKDILDETFSFIEKGYENPFYINVWLSDVHATLNPSQEQMDRVANESDRNKPIHDIPYSGIQQVYYAALLEMDKQIGIFLDKLDKLGVKENTLIIFSSDNGPEDYHINNSRHSGAGNTGPFRGRKRSIYEGGIRVPFIMSWPGNIPMNKINETSVVTGVDFLPTIASLIDIEIGNDFELDGENMIDVWKGEARYRKKEIFWEWRYRIHSHIIHKSPMIAVRDGDYKLLLDPDLSRVELYNIIEDSSELNNLALLMPKKARELSEKALKWYETIPKSPVHDSAGKNNWIINR
ncbi:MAG: sulfatase [bacterium]